MCVLFKGNLRSSQNGVFLLVGIKVTIILMNSLYFLCFLIIIVLNYAWFWFVFGNCFGRDSRNAVWSWRLSWRVGGYCCFKRPFPVWKITRGKLLHSLYWLLRWATPWHDRSEPCSRITISLFLDGGQVICCRPWKGSLSSGSVVTCRMPNFPYLHIPTGTAKK